MHRRALLAGLVGVATGVAPAGRLLAQTGQQPADLQACMSEPGLALYLSMLSGQLPMTSQELLPGATWQLFSSPYSTAVFLYPPDWTGQVLFASTFTQHAAPQWTGQQQSASGITSARVTSSDASAAWESVAGGIQGVALTLEQVVAIAEGGLLGDGYTGTRMCAHTEPLANGGTAWLTALDANGTIVLTNGTLFSDPSGPYSVITYYGMAAPQAQFEQTMRSVFLPIQWQLLQSGGSLPTPTPTPGF